MRRDATLYSSEIKVKRRNLAQYFRIDCGVFYTGEYAMHGYFLRVNVGDDNWREEINVRVELINSYVNTFI